MRNYRRGPYELKFDGYRALALKTDGQVQLLSRNGRDFTSRFTTISRALEALPDETVIDGEIVAYDAKGRPSLNVLQNHLSDRLALHLYAFDLLALRGKDLTRDTLEERHELLRRKVMPLLPDSIRYSETLKASAAQVIEVVREQGLKGVAAKRRDGRYEPGKRSGAWQKMRINKVRELVIGFYTPAPRNFDALLVGLRRSKAGVRRQGAGRFHASIAGLGVQAIPRSRKRSMSVQEFAGVTPGSVGRRLDGRGHEEMPVAQAAPDRSNRISGMDGRKSSPPLEVSDPTDCVF